MLSCLCFLLFCFLFFVVLTLSDHDTVRTVGGSEEPGRGMFIESQLCAGHQERRVCCGQHLSASVGQISLHCRRDHADRKQCWKQQERGEGQF